MANTLGVYNPTFYAQEALIQLEEAMGMGTRVHRAFEAERSGSRYEPGDTISIRRPSTFTAQNAPSTAQDLDTGTVSISLDQWKEVKFKLTDKELAYTRERIIRDHIRPAAVALANNIDTALCTLYTDVPWVIAQAAAPASVVVNDITAVRKQMFTNKVPLGDIGRVHFMVGGDLEQGLLNLAAFSQQQGAGDQGVATQMRGSLGMKYGYEIFANQNVQDHTQGTASSGADQAGAINNGAGYSKGDTSIVVDSFTGSETILEGDTFSIAGNTQRYAVQADVTLATGAGTITFEPGLAADVVDDAVVTLHPSANDTNARAQNLAFHRNAFALVLAPLPDMANELGAKVVTIADPITGLSLRSRIYYVGNSSEVHVALDVLYGIRTLDGNLAVRGVAEAAA